MTDVRQARLDDMSAISALARDQIGAWQRMTPDGSVEDVDYAALSVYERWLHGGPWMSIETGAIHLGRLLLGAGMPVIAVRDGDVAAYAEVYTGTEPAPYHQHAHVSGLIARDDEAKTALFQWITNDARQRGLRRVTVNFAANDEDARSFYAAQRMTPTDEMRRMILSAKSGQVFYKAVDHHDENAEQIAGWHLTIGRLGSARYQWETLWPRTWDAIPQVKARPTHRLAFNAAGNEALVLVRQHLYIPRRADVFCWTPKPPSSQLITAIRDWANREGYRQLVLPTVADAVKTLGLDAEPDGYREQIYAIDLR